MLAQLSQVCACRAACQGLQGQGTATAHRALGAKAGFLGALHLIRHKGGRWPAGPGLRSSWPSFAVARWDEGHRKEARAGSLLSMETIPATLHCWRLC